MNIDELRRARPRSRFARLSLGAMAVVVAYAWLSGDLELGRLFSARSAQNLQRFLGEIRPYPLQGREWDWEVFRHWLEATLDDAGGEAVLSTVALSVAAICLAGLLAAVSDRGSWRPWRPARLAPRDHRWAISQLRCLHPSRRPPLP